MKLILIVVIISSFVLCVNAQNSTAENTIEERNNISIAWHDNNTSIPFNKIIENNKQLDIVPNPGSSKFSIMARDIKDAAIMVFDSKGAMLVNKNNVFITKNYLLDLEYLSDGLYNVVIMADGLHYTKKLIIKNDTLFSIYFIFVLLFNC